MAILENTTNLAAAFFARVKATPKGIVYVQAVASDELASESNADQALRKRQQFGYEGVAERVRKIGSYLKQRGLKPGQRVAIISNTRPEWMEADLAVLALGGVVVSVYPSLTAEEIGYILHDSEARFVFAENDEQLKKLEWLKEHSISIPATEDRPAGEALVSIGTIILFEDAPSRVHAVTWQEALAKANAFDAQQLNDWRTIQSSDLATLVYTSGTTGPPKGVMQTHANHLANIRQAHESGIYSEDSTIALFLPLAHSFAKLMGYIGFLTNVCLEFPAVVDRKTSKLNQNSITKDLREGSASVIPVVPRMLEKMQEGIEKRARSASISGFALRLCLWAANARYAAGETGKKPLPLVEIAYSLTASLRKKVKVLLFGSRFLYAVSGGAKLRPQVNKFFDALEIEVLEGYGLTETCVATNVNRRGKKKIGSVGPALTRDIEIRITEEGEICFRGPNISSGYFNRPTATRQSWDEEGWFHTGDLGRLDEEGFLFIEGRKKELIVTAGGKKIPPDPIEQKIKQSTLISQALLFGDEKPYCVALLSIDHEAVRHWSGREGISGDLDFSEGGSLHRTLWNHVQGINAHLASFESIKKIAIIKEEWTVENGLLTPTMKVKRKEVVKRYRDEIERLYQMSGEQGGG